MTGTNVDVAALAKLARIEITQAEMKTLEGEIPEILEFVETIQNISTLKDADAPGLRNVMRADEHPHEAGKFTETLLRAAPARQGDRVAVQQVISRKSAQGGSASGRK